ncbi:hypothetical protein tb265_44380 [Gemmatimonadetes bacterium T265]|nr:hypothetical protein tb265_44380 [Gemmatimonadetes bacterium T265]
MPRAFHVRGPLDADALGRALDGLVARHDVLRSVYATADGGPAQVVRHGARAPLERLDLSGLPPAARDGELARALAERAAYHFDLAADVLLRATLVRLADDEHVLFLLTHHIVSDGWSKSVTFRDLGALYAAELAGGGARAAALPTLPLQFADHARRERARADSGALDAPLAYWREQLRGPLPVLRLADTATGDPAPGADLFAGDVRETVLPRTLVDGMRRLGQARGASLYMVLLAAYQSLLHRYTGQDEIVVGSPTAGRDDEDTHDLIGYFAGALVLRTSFAGDPAFGALLDRVRDTCLDAYEHQDVPFEKLVLELQKGEALTHAPLFQCVLTMEDTIPAALRLDGAAVEPLDVAVSATKFDLTLLFSEHPDGLRLRLAFRTALVDGTRAERVLGHLRTLLDAAVADASVPVSRLPLLTAAEHAELAAWNATAADLGPAADVATLFEAWAARVPNQPAVVAGDATLTYAELDARAARLAARLQALGAGPDAPVGLLLDRSAAAVIGLLGALKAGAAYVPLPVDGPAARVAQQLAASGARVVVTDAAGAALLPAGTVAVAVDADDARGEPPAPSAARRPAPDDLAYVLFTSGSTGAPKGVSVTHANVVHYARAIARVLAGGDGLSAPAGWHCGVASTLAADLGLTSVWAALLGGGTLHVLPHTAVTEPASFAEYAAAHPLDLLKLTPGHLRALAAGLNGYALAAVLPRRWLVLGGEALPVPLARHLVDALGAGRLLNHYGPTETTIGACALRVDAAVLAAAEARAARSVPVGRPLANVRVYVVDAHGGEQPVGVAGELVVAGQGVSRGYVGQPERTAERFGALPELGDDGEPWAYRTGDRARRLADGTLEFLGRVDHQVKIRGYRVEPDEVAAVLRTHPAVADAAVVARPAAGAPDGVDAEPRLFAYVVPAAAGGAAAPDVLAVWLAERLPAYLVPDAIVALEQLPLTPNGKLDRAALPAPIDPAAESAATPAVVAPRTETERQLAAVWQDVLKREAVGVTESFLALGGHSLLAIRVLGRISKQFGVRLPLRALFEHPTVAQLAELVDAERRAKDDAALRDALAAVEGLTEADATRLLGQVLTDAP